MSVACKVKVVVVVVVVGEDGGYELWCVVVWRSEVVEILEKGSV